jgi:hypothetical protein
MLYKTVHSIDELEMRIQLHYPLPALKRLLYRFAFLLLLFLPMFRATSGQTPDQIIATVNNRLNRINDYRADVVVVCDIPSIRIKPIQARVIYRKPDKFKVKAEGILVLPKQNANFVFAALSDKDTYTAVGTGTEMINGTKTDIVNVIPSADTSDLILGKFWIDALRGLVMKSQLTTRSQGTILIEFTYGSQAGYGLPDQMVFTIDAAEFKLPKSLALDLGTSSAGKKSYTTSGKGKITLTFTGYDVNKGVTNRELEE